MATSMSTSLPRNPSAGGSAAAGKAGGIGIGLQFAYVVMLLGIVILAASGLGTLAFGEPPMTHWVLMAHVGSSPLFAIGLALVAVSWAGECANHGRAAQFFFWILMLAGVGVVLSGVLPMTPLLGTHGQHTMYLVHRYAGIVVTAACVLHLLSLKANR